MKICCHSTNIILELSGEGEGTSNVNYEYSAKTVGNLVCAHRIPQKFLYITYLHVFVNCIILLATNIVFSVQFRFFFFFAYMALFGKVCIVGSTKFTT